MPKSNATIFGNFQKMMDTFQNREKIENCEKLENGEKI